MSIKIIDEKCTGCTLCLKVCPFAALSMKNKKAVIDYDKCTLCGACVDSCKFLAIELKRESSRTPHLEDYKGVWIFAEQKKGKVQSVVFELLNKGRELANKLDDDPGRKQILTSIIEGLSAVRMAETMSANMMYSMIHGMIGGAGNKGCLNCGIIVAASSVPPGT